jgi:glycosyltransferase involved in cell wall biosynthesis
MNCYNGEKFLKEAIDSIYAQSYQDWEIIFIDNCSTDNSAKIAKQYGEKLKYYKTEGNIELGEARVFGLEHCVGKFLAFLDTDDCYLPDKLEKQVTRMKKNSTYKMSYSGYFFIDELSKVTKKFTPKSTSGFVFPQQLKNYEINMQSVMLRNGQDIKFDDSLKFSPDYDLFMQICAESDVGVIKEPLIKYRKLKDSLTNKSIALWAVEVERSLNKILNKQPKFKQKYPKELQFSYAKIAYYRAQFFLKKGGKQEAIKALSKYKNISLIYFGLYLLSLMPVFFWHKIHQLK